MAQDKNDEHYEALKAFEAKSFNSQGVQKKFFQTLNALDDWANPENQAKYVPLFFSVLEKIKSLKAAEQNALLTFLSKIHIQIQDKAFKRIFLHQLEPLIKSYNLPKLQAAASGLSDDQLNSSNMHAQITRAPINLSPKRIIAFNKLDLRNSEVIESLKIAYERHKADGCLITCSRQDIQSFGHNCETLVLVGHGSFYRLGERDAGKQVDTKYIETARKGNILSLGPYHGTIDKIVTEIIEDFQCLPKLNHCRVLMCRAGALDDKVSAQTSGLFQKKHKADASAKSLTQAWDPDRPETLAFDEQSLAYALWQRLFTGDSPTMDSQSDFALTAAASLIIPEVAGGNYQAGFFRVKDAGHSIHPNTLLASTYVTVATPASTKLAKQLDEPAHYTPVPHKK